jgi:hypothetical protein
VNTNNATYHQDIVSAAARLLTEDGSNPEYDRAIVELTSDLLGLTQDDKQGVEDILRVRQVVEHMLRGEWTDHSDPTPSHLLPDEFPTSQ